MRHLLYIPLLAAGAALALPAMAQDGATVEVGESEEFGPHLTDGDGRALYLFTTDKPGVAESTEAEISCTSEDCLNAWPLFTTSGEPTAGNIDEAMLATMDYDGQTVVTYNGWPLYYFIRDEGADSPQGQEVESFGGEWYLVTPEGEKLEGEGSDS